MADESGGRRILGQEKVRSLRLNQLQVHLRGSAEDLELLLRMRTHISEARRKFISPGWQHTDAFFGFNEDHIELGEVTEMDVVSLVRLFLPQH